VFASHGDNITPPQQALNWIVDAYASEDEIRIRGQRIVYMVHEKVGHLGIFVSSSVAKKEHSEMASTMKTIEALAPGLYEMVIEDVVGDGHDAHFYVSFYSRKLSDIAALDDGRDEEKAHRGGGARLGGGRRSSTTSGRGPAVRAVASPMATEIAKTFHPLRAQRWAFASWNPAMRMAQRFAEQAKAARAPVGGENPFVALEKLWADSVAQSLDFARDIRDMGYEAMFYALWGGPAAIAFGAGHAQPRTKKTPRELRLMPQVRQALMHVGAGGFVEAVIRMLIMLAEARGSVRRDRLERSARVLSTDKPFCDLDPALRGQIIHEQSIIAQFEPDAAIDALPRMLEDAESRAEAIAVVEYIVGPLDEMEPHTIHRLQEFRSVLDLDPIDLPEALRVKMMRDSEADAAREAARMTTENRPYDELAIGDEAVIERLCRAEDLYIFAHASGNHNPMHLPDEDGDGDGVPEAVAPGMWVASLISAVLGNILPGPGTLYRSQSLRFLERAAAGDTLTVRVSVREKRPDDTSSSSTRRCGCMTASWSPRARRRSSRRRARCASTTATFPA
jgi:acyl dehydratase